ncbi:probable leucine-rich repeat receptor-like serine/threonine-protein kinase At3g14840 isoform X1 [Solanum stenotomum]|uniref:probable leucine-rich repeat receptor-like serine/threonine-protein kinase At3g14840 isoform X1 n=1 Tax=Solanum stenotomum TaxID=172797 RepID=UPI0020D04A47|nr:probable leucine-rich repeat receptor-like serine/threonine-protein kinase At3g14840 isoform X1 [Solanum stenotomum]
MELFQENSETWLICRVCKLPEEVNKLTKLTELRLSGNNFTGIFPSFESLKNLQKLEIQASGFEGPVPPSISVLTEMKEL